jgi:ribokinase
MVGRVGEDDLRNLGAVLEHAGILLLQLEIPLEMVISAAKLAKEKGVRVILDPAPAQTLPAEIYPEVDILTPNETKAERRTGLPINSFCDAARAARILKDHGTQDIIIKMGSRGAFALIDGIERTYESFPVTAVDTVAAGDAFNGALAVALSENIPLSEAITWGMAGGLCRSQKRGPNLPCPDGKTSYTFSKQGNK